MRMQFPFGIEKGPPMKAIRLPALAVGLVLLASAAARAAGSYRLQPIVRLGDKIGDAKIKIGHSLWAGSLNDSGQLVFVTGSVAGSPLLVQYAEGKFTPIIVAGQDGPIGKWPPIAILWSPVSMNQAGNLVFSMQDQQSGMPLGTFRWDAKSRRVTPIALKGMPAVNNLTFASGGGPVPVINNRSEVVFVADVPNSTGEAKSGIFFLGQDGKLQAVALPDQTLPSGDRIASASNPSLNDAGVVAFLAVRKGETTASAYVWEKGEITPVAVAGTPLPDKSKLPGVLGVRVNNKNRGVLVEAPVKTATGAHALYLWADNKLSAVAVPGQEMPGGGKLHSVEGQVGYANDAGQCAFLANLVGRDTAAYLLEPDGKLSLILKSGATAEPGQITRVGETIASGIALNNKGQITVTVTIASVRGDVLALLTPQ